MECKWVYFLLAQTNQSGDFICHVMCTNKYINVYNQIGKPYSSTTLLQEYFDSSISNLITTCAAGVVHLENTFKMLHSRWPSLNSAADMYMLTWFSLPLIAALNMSPRLLATTISAKQWHRNLDRLSEKHPGLLSLLLLHVLAFLWISFPQRECNILCCHKHFLDLEAIRYNIESSHHVELSLHVTTTDTYFWKTKAHLLDARSIYQGAAWAEAIPPPPCQGAEQAKGKGKADEDLEEELKTTKQSNDK